MSLNTYSKDYSTCLLQQHKGIEVQDSQALRLQPLALMQPGVLTALVSGHHCVKLLQRRVHSQEEAYQVNLSHQLSSAYRTDDSPAEEERQCWIRRFALSWLKVRLAFSLIQAKWTMSRVTSLTCHCACCDLE